MTHHRPPQQPPLPRRDQRAPPQGETGVWGAQQQVLALPPLEGCPPPNPHHQMAESGAGFLALARCKPPGGGGVTAEGKHDQQYSAAAVAIGTRPPQYIVVTHEPP